MDNTENTNAKVPDAEPVFINKELADEDNSPIAKPAVLTVPDGKSPVNGIKLLKPIVKVHVPKTLTKEELQKAQEGFSKMDDNDKENEDVYAGDKRIADDDEKSIEDTVIENCDALEQSFEKLVEKHSQLSGFLSLVKTHLADLKNRCTGLK